MPRKTYKEAELRVYKTKDYSLFKTIKGNRPVNDHHVAQITTSLVKKNMLNRLPIAVNEKFEVIDGQHRLEACKNNDWEVYFVLVDGADLRDVQLLNAYAKPWAMQDYMDSYISLGNREYQFLRDFIKEFSLPISVALSILDSKSLRSRAIAIARFKAGEFVPNEIEYAMTIAKKMVELRAYATPDAGKDRNFMRAVIKMHHMEHIDHDTLTDKFEKSKVTIERLGAVKQYLHMFEEVYSWKSKKIVRFYSKQPHN